MVEESAMHGGALERDGRVSEMRTLRVLLLRGYGCVCFSSTYMENHLGHSVYVAEGNNRGKGAYLCN